MKTNLLYISIFLKFVTTAKKFIIFIAVIPPGVDYHRTVFNIVNILPKHDVFVNK